VQHAIRDNKQFLKDLILSKNASIFVSGRAKNMPKSVEKAFVDVCEDESVIKQMKKDKRY